MGQSYLRLADDSYFALDASGRAGYFTKAGVELFSVDASGNIRITGNVASTAQGALQGLGYPNQVASPAPATAQAGAVTNHINYTPPASAGVYRISAMVNVTAWTTPASFTLVVTYKDDQGNAQTETLATFESDGTFSAIIDSIDRFYALPFVISIDNSATAITLSTTGTFTGTVTYSLAAVLERIR